MNDLFAEYREVSVGEPLRQGDVLEALDPGAGMWQRHLFVMTADCDFAHSKHQGRVTCVPLLMADEYLSELQLPKVREQLVKSRLVELREIFSKSALSISERRLREWVSEEEPRQIVEILELQPADVRKALSALQAIRMMDTPVGSLKEGVDLLVEAQLISVNPPKRTNAMKKVLERLQATYTQPPGDALFLTAISSGQDTGYFAYLRHIEQVWEPNISLGPSHRGCAYHRISRMEDRFTHALAQRFAMVFMSIGLPRQYEELRDLHSEILRETLQ